MFATPVVAAMLAVAAPVPKPSAVQIDLSEAYSTVSMKDIKKAGVADSDNKDNDLEAVRKAAYRVGASNVFLVRGESFAQALAATRTMYGVGLGGNGEPLVGMEAKNRGEVWVGAFLGNSFTSPPAYAIDRIETQGQTVRVVFSRPPHRGQSDDVSPYFVWAKLGKLEPGVYRLELTDADLKGEVVMSRRVEVKKDRD